MPSVLEKIFNKSDIKDIKKTQKQINDNWYKIEERQKLHKKINKDFNKVFDFWNLSNKEKLKILLPKQKKALKICEKFEKKYNFKSKNLHNTDIFELCSVDDAVAWQDAYDVIEDINNLQN